MENIQEFIFELVCDGNDCTDAVKSSRCCPGECIGGPNQKEI